MKNSAPIQRTAGALALAVSSLFVVFAACDKPAPAPKAPDAGVPKKMMDEPTGPFEAPRIPSEPGKFAPTLARLADGETYDPAIHQEVELCSGCHADIVAQWKDSIHAFASQSNPFFRASFDDFVQDAGHEKAQFCSGCHDPVLVFGGAGTSEIEPADPRAHKGVSCMHCHGIVEATNDGNASHVLSTAPIPIPTPGDEDSLKKHFARVGSPALRTNELCMSCHRAFLGPATGHEVVIPGVNEVTAFKESRYGGSSASRIDSGLDEQNCTSCHMPKVGPKDQASHRFIGSHATLAAAMPTPEQLELVTKMVTEAVDVYVGAVGVGKVRIEDQPKMLKPGEKVWADVVVFNRATGHSFPGGAKDLRDTWIEVEVRDATGKLVRSAGTDHEKTGDDPGAMVLHSVVASDEGKVVKQHRVESFRAAINDFSIAPRDALVSRYTWEVSDPPPKLPLEVKARLRHRRIHEPLHKQACDNSKRPRDKAFAAAAAKQTGRTIDPCKPQPIIEVGTAWAKLGDDARSDQTPTWLRHYQRGLGLLHNVQENLPEAIDAFDHALTALPDDADKVDRARVLFGKGLAIGAQGRIQAAMDEWAKAEELVGEQAAIHYARGNVHQRTFHNEEAKMWYLKASKLVDDDRVWRSLAVSAGSVGDAKTAYDAARAGLRLEPRDPHLLRNQMLALRKLPGVEPEWVKDAEAAFNTYKRDEMAAIVRDKCSAADENCRDERQPMQVTRLRDAE